MMLFNGCSFTKYCWPTWADMLCYGYSDRFNIGNMGSGNERTLLTSYPYLDKVSHVCIQWSQSYRFDYCKNGKWNIDGNITLNHCGNWPKVNWFFDFDHFDNKDIIIKNILKDLLESKKIKHCFLDFNDVFQQAKTRSYTFKGNTNTNKKIKNYIDGHPDVFLGYEIATNVADKLEIDWRWQEIKEILPVIDEKIKKIEIFNINKEILL